MAKIQSFSDRFDNEIRFFKENNRGVRPTRVIMSQEVFDGLFYEYEKSNIDRAMRMQFCSQVMGMEIAIFLNIDQKNTIELYYK